MNAFIVFLQVCYDFFSFLFIPFVFMNIAASEHSLFSVLYIFGCLQAFVVHVLFFYFNHSNPTRVSGKYTWVAFSEQTKRNEYCASFDVSIIF